MLTGKVGSSSIGEALIDLVDTEIVKAQKIERAEYDRLLMIKKVNSGYEIKKKSKVDLVPNSKEVTKMTIFMI